MNNNLRFTDNADATFQYAGSIALQFGSYAIDTEHILYGLSKMKESVSSKILAQYGITAENLSTILKRNDIKKSEAYESGFLEGTVPMYDAYMNLKKSIIRSLKED